MKIIIGLIIIIILAFAGAAVYFKANTPNSELMGFMINKSGGTLGAEDIIPTPTMTPTPTPKFAKIGDHKYTRFPGILPKEERTGKKAVIATGKGNIEFEIFGDESPKAASNFIYLAKDGYYDTLIFHRVVPGFVIQGGDPLGNGTGGPGYSFEDEPVQRGYTKGIVAMANAGPDTNGSQFFIMLQNNELPPNYTIFGRVIEGQDTVEKIQPGDVMERVTIEDYVAQ